MNHLKYTNKTVCCGEMDFPEILCDLDEYPDYIALYNQPGDYHRTTRTCVGFYNFDNEIDGLDGLYNAIKYDNKKRLDFFKKRFEGVKYFMMPDYSIFGDVQAYVNYNRMGMAREVSIWLTMENNSVVIPNLAAGSTRDFKYMYDGYERVKVAGISTKSKLTDKNNRALLQATIDEAVNRMPCLETFIVYDVSADNKAVELENFEYARKMEEIQAGLRVGDLTDAQRSTLNKLANTVSKHLTEQDYSGVERDLAGNPVPKGAGGFFDHVQEMKDSYRGLKKARRSIEGSLKNPNLGKKERIMLQDSLDVANYHINRIDKMFKEYGGIDKWKKK